MEKIRIKIRHTIWVHYLTFSRKAFALLLTFTVHLVLNAYLSYSYDTYEDHSVALITIPFYLLVEYLLMNMIRIKSETDRFSKKLKQLKERCHLEEVQYNHRMMNSQ